MRSRAAWLWWALLLSCSVASGERLTRGEYALLVGRAADGLEAATAAEQGQQERAAEAIAMLPEEAEIVVAPGGSPFRADNRDLRGRLHGMAASGPEGVEEAAEVLANLRQGLTVLDVEPPAAAQAVLAEVLAQKEFRPGIAARLRAWLYQQAFRLLERLISTFPDLDLELAGRVARGVGWAIVAAVAAVVLYLIVRLTGALVGQRGRPGMTAPTAREAAPTRTSAEWLSEAENAFAAREYQCALRALHMAALVRLDELGIARFDRAATDGQLIRRLRGSGREAAVEALVGLNRLFVPAWYGGRSVGPTEYEAAQSHWRTLETLTEP